MTTSEGAPTSGAFPVVEAECVEDAIAALFGQSVTVVGRRPVSGGCINSASRLTLSDGRELFLKENSGRFRDMFRREAEGLLLLAAADGPSVPRPLACSPSGGADQFLLLEHVGSAPRSVNFWETFGRAFARMHGASAERYGLERDNFIGATPQRNTREARWVEFFGKQRLGYQVELAQRRGLADRALVDGVHRVIDRLDTLLLVDEERPALLHGDLWSGNYMVGEDGEAVLIDPAVYYGHPEADLAMTEMFGRMDPRFYAAYDEARPIAPGYDDRREIYNLYHALNHLNLFGQSYRGSVMSVVRRFG